ncbi:hypothetical protein MATL_G00075970 [Megalops atlanticus]|uniref:non-specific serine/threonine protein kinase n=1 Tax=Megalops atlanticus TaxID=7932 RepID=A0A9D3Q6C7_MEGAT|nr:hypothetical protein MATL_G00075970 [Megalops atlanticus]
MASTLIGTPYYMSPELLSNKPYNHKSDVWALGCCVYEMATLKHAFNAKDMNSLVYRIVEGKLPQMPSVYDPQLGELIKGMLSKKPEERPDVRHILRQPYIKRQILMFLEATKEKTATSRRKAANSKPNSSSSVVSANTNSKRPLQSPSDHNMRGKMKEKKHSKPLKGNKGVIEAPSTPMELPPKAPAQGILNSSGASLATISNVNLDIQPQEERGHRKTELPAPQPHLSNSDKYKPAEDRGAKKEDPFPPQLQDITAVSGISDRGDERVSDGSMMQDHTSQPEMRPLNEGKPVAESQLPPVNMDDKDDTVKLLQDLDRQSQPPELRESFNSTEKLLEPFVPVLVQKPSCHDLPPALSKEDEAPLQPPSSASEPSVSCQQRQSNRENMRGVQDRVNVICPRPLPPPPSEAFAIDARKKSRGHASKTKSVTSSSSSVCNSNDSSVTASQGRPLTARERRRLKQSQEENCYLVVPASRRVSCDVFSAEGQQADSQTASVCRSASDTAIKTNKLQGGLPLTPADEDECSSSTSSTDRSEGDCRERKSDTNDMHDLVQLMTQTLRMDSREPECQHDGPGSAPLPEFRLNRKYRDTLALHGKAKDDEEEEFRFREFPSDVTSGPAKIKRAIEHLRTDVVRGLGVKLLDRVLEIMEEDDEDKRELQLREQMGEDKYQAYAVMVRQLKFFEDVTFRE